MLLTSIVDVVGAVTSVANGRIRIVGLIVAEEDCAVALLDTAAFDTLQVVLEDGLNGVLPFDSLLLIRKLDPFI